jgi:ABC-type multidrug transport system fused ATPase/permease subunit
MIPSVSTHLRALLRLAWSERRYYGPGLLCVVIGMFTTLAYPQAIRLTIDQGLRGGHPERINQLALVMFVLLIGEVVANFFRNYLFNLGAEHVTARLRQQAFEHLLRQEIAFFDNASTGGLTTRLWSETPNVQWLVGERLGDALRYTFYSAGGIVLLFYTSRLLTLVVIVTLPLLALATSLLGRRIRHATSKVQEAYAEAGTIAGEAIGGIRTVRAFSQEKKETERHWEKLCTAVRLARRSLSGYAAGNALSIVSGEGSALLALWIGGLLIIRGQLTTGALISFMLYAFLVAKGVRGASDFWTEAHRTLGATAWIFGLLERRPLLSTEGGDKLARVEGRIVLENLHFSFDGRRDIPALSGINLEIAPGESVALVGRSGSGKSTIIHLLLRFYDPTGGRILLDGRDIRQLDPSWLRRQIAVVMQEPVLFSRSIADNIRYATAEASTQELTEAAALARANEFIDSFPNGYDTEIGERGVQLSGGQRQRLAIARAVIMRPRILILDEATSALDAENEAFVREALRTRLDYQPTTLVVAHRLSTVVDVDRVVLIDHGQIVSAGRHDQLLHTSDSYRRLIESQLLTV